MSRVSIALLVLASLAQVADTSRTKLRLTLLTADVRKYAPLIVEALYHDNVAGTTLSALSETEKPIGGDNWFWTDDNAKSLEALTLRPVFPRFVKQVGQLVRFVMANSPPPFVFRRRADENLDVKSDKVNDFRVATGLMNFHGDLLKVDVRHGYRFHDDRTEDAVKYSADPIKFLVRGKPYVVDPKQNLSAAIRREAHATILVQKVELKADSEVVGQVVYSYRIEANRPYVTLRVDVMAGPKQSLTDVEISTALDQLDSVSDIRYSKFFSYPGDMRAVIDADGATKTHVLKSGAARWWSLIQDGDLGFSYAINTIVDTPQRLRNIVSIEEQPRAFRHVRATYALGDLAPGQATSIAERKVLLAGGFYNAMGNYAAVFERLQDFPGIDLSISYDIGAELNGVASAYLADKTRVDHDAKAEPVVYKPDTRTWFDAILNEYVAKFPVRVGDQYPYLFTRGHAFVMLALDTMYTATGDPRYLDTLRHLADVMTELQVKKGPLADNFVCVHHSFFLDCHASAMIAMARAAVATGDRRYAEAAVRGLNAYGINPKADTGQDVYFKQRGSAKEGDSYYWIFKAGLLLRSLESLEVLAEAGLAQLSRGQWEVIGDLQRRAVNYIGRAGHARGNLEELLTCHKAGETNSETQAWALLGLYPIEHERAESRIH